MEYSRIGEGLHTLENELTLITAFLNQQSNNISDNQEVQIIAKKKKLKILNFHANRLTTLHDLSIRSSSAFKSLTELNLSSNNFSTWSGLSDLSYLPMLFILDLSGNRFTNLLSCPYLPSLKHLLIAFNLLDNILAVNDNCPNLLQLDIRSNNISTPDDLEPMRALLLLQHVQLGNRNPILAKKSPQTAQMIATFFDHCSSLITVDNLSRNEWKEEEIIYAPTPHYDRIIERYRSATKFTKESEVVKDVVSDLQDSDISSNSILDSLNQTNSPSNSPSYSPRLSSPCYSDIHESFLGSETTPNVAVFEDEEMKDKLFDVALKENSILHIQEMNEIKDEVQEIQDEQKEKDNEEYIPEVQLAQDIREIVKVFTVEASVQTEHAIESLLPRIDDSDIDEDNIILPAKTSSQEQQTEIIQLIHTSTDVEGLCTVVVAPKRYDLDLISGAIYDRYHQMESRSLKQTIFQAWKYVYLEGKSLRALESNRQIQERRQNFDKTSLEALNKRNNNLEAQLMASKRSSTVLEEKISQMVSSHAMELQAVKEQSLSLEKEMVDLKHTQESSRIQEIEKIQQAFQEERKLHEQSHKESERKSERRLLALQTTCEMMATNSKQLNKEHELLLQENTNLKSSLLSMKSGIETLKSEIQSLDRAHAMELENTKMLNKDTLSKLLRRLEVAEIGLNNQESLEKERRKRQDESMVSIGVNTVESVADVELALKIKGKIVDDMQAIQETMKERIKSLENESFDLRQAYNRLEDENDHLQLLIKQLTDQNQTTKSMENAILGLLDELTEDRHENRANKTTTEIADEDSGESDEEYLCDERVSSQRIQHFKNKLHQVNFSLNTIDSHGTDDEEEMEEEIIDRKNQERKKNVISIKKNQHPLLNRQLGCSKQLCAIEKKELQVELQKQINDQNLLRRAVQHDKQLQKSEIEALQKQIETLQSSVGSVNKTLNFHKVQYEEKFIRMDSERKKLGFSIKHLQIELSNKEDELRKTKSAIEKMKQAFNAASIA